MATQHTRSQRRLLNFLQTQTQGVSAQDIYAELRRQNQGMGLATVYRALETLKREGAVQVRMLSNGESLYSCVHQDQHHLTCLQCGQSFPLEECPIHQLETQLQQAHQFHIFYHTLEFFGMCDRCKIEQANSKTDD